RELVEPSPPERQQPLRHRAYHTLTPAVRKPRGMAGTYVVVPCRSSPCSASATEPPRPRATDQPLPSVTPVTAPASPRARTSFVVDVYCACVARERNQAPPSPSDGATQNRPTEKGHETSAATPPSVRCRSGAIPRLRSISSVVSARATVARAPTQSAPA